MGQALIEVHELATSGEPSLALELPFERRQHSRLRATLDDGDEVAVFLPRGTVLRDGMRLQASDGRVIAVRAAAEEVSTASGLDGVGLARVAYHLGNRHVPLEIGADYVRYQRDRVLDDLVRRLGGRVAVGRAPFEPEPGAYEHGHA